MSDQTKMLEECWAEEGCIRLRIESDDNGSRIVSIVDITEGWPGVVVGQATLARFRRERIAKAIGEDKP